jgi:gliding motility-associated protein GldL
MTTYSKYNFVYRLQKWMDSVPGQTFLNYAYSWGASIVILGTLFKLTHLPGANFFLFLGMGTEVFVFFISAFDRPFDKTTDGMELDTHVATAEDQVEPATSAVAAAATPATVIGGNGGTIIIGGGSVGSGVPSPAGETSESSETSQTSSSSQASVDTEAIAAVSSSVTTMAGGAAVALPQVNPELEEATANYVDELKRLTEMLSKVTEQSERLARDSEEMENLNRTLTGICKVYELQLKSASSQIGTIDDINAQTHRMAEQIAELNGIYARMIEAMTVNMRAASPLAQQ